MMNRAKSFIGKKDNLAQIKEYWQGYLDANPSTRDLVQLFFCNDKEKLNELAWQELKQRDDLEKEHLVDVITHCWNPEWVKLDAWSFLSNKELEESERERIVGKLGPTHSISQEIEKTYGRNKESFLGALKEVL